MQKINCPNIPSPKLREYIHPDNSIFELMSDLRWIGTLQSFLTFAGSIFSGRYFDSHGARSITILGTSLSIGATIGLACGYLNDKRIFRCVADPF